MVIAFKLWRFVLKSKCLCFFFLLRAGDPTGNRKKVLIYTRSTWGFKAPTNHRVSQKNYWLFAVASSFFLNKGNLGYLNSTFIFDVQTKRSKPYWRRQPHLNWVTQLTVTKKRWKSSCWTLIDKHIKKSGWADFEDSIQHKQLITSVCKSQVSNLPRELTSTWITQQITKLDREI